MRKLICRTTCVAAVCLFASSQAQAFTVVQQDALKLSFNGLGRAGVESVVTQGDGEAEPFVSMARLQAKVAYKGVGSMMLQYEFRNGEAFLLDAVATWTPSKFLKFKAGRTKTPVSMEFALKATELRFHRRAKLKSLVATRAVGANGNMEFKVNGVALGFDVGAWTAPGIDIAAGVKDGMMLTLRTYAKLPNGVMVQAAVADHFFTSRAIMLDDNVHQEAVLDVAAKYERGRWLALTEVALVLSEQVEVRPFGLYSMVARKIPLDAGPVLEPAVAYDLLRKGDAVGHFGTVAMTAYWAGDRFTTSADYQAGYEDGQVTHSAFARLQVGF